ncbi:MAG TPA: hypothetical protein VIA10_05270 [Gaiellaceae bacterium]
MRRRERERIMRQGVVLPETPRDRRNLSGLEEDVRDSPLRGEPLPLRLRAGRSDPSAYLASLGGPRPYMTRLREIARLTAEHEAALAEARDLVRDESAWRRLAATWDFGEVNDLIERHNRWYPVEARLPMDPRTGDYALVNGQPYSKPPLDATWVLARFPARPSPATSRRG